MTGFRRSVKTLCRSIRRESISRWPNRFLESSNKISPKTKTSVRKRWQVAFGFRRLDFAAKPARKDRISRPRRCRFCRRRSRRVHCFTFGVRMESPRKKDLPRTVATEFQPQGRKAYLIHDESLLSWVSRNDEEKLRKQKAKVGPLRPEIEFLFDITFDNLSATELGLLLFSLKPTSGFRHRLGMGKPFGLGTVEVHPQVCS